MKSSHRVCGVFWNRLFGLALAAGFVSMGVAVLMAADAPAAKTKSDKPAAKTETKKSDKPVNSAVGKALLNVLGLDSSGSSSDDEAPVIIYEAEDAVPPKRPAAKKPPEPPTSHEFKKAIKLRSSDGKQGVQTICADAQGHVLALVAPPRYFDQVKKQTASEVHVLDAEGEKVAKWEVDFAAQAINVGPDGAVYVAGDGTVAKFEPDGKLVKKLELPHIAEALKNKDGLRKQAEDQLKQQRKSYEQMVKSYGDRLKKLEALDQEKLTPSQKRMMSQLKSSLKIYENEAKSQGDVKVDQIVNSLVSRLRIINSVAVSEQDVFVVCGESQGYGYAMWRMDRNFENPKQVMKGMRGCCGQMDAQVFANDVLVAENCSHAFARYDRDGKKIGQWGKGPRNGDASGDAKCFGGCCNPMNVRAAANGDIYTAESEGIIKRFSSKGEFLAVVGKRPLSGGCKNVAVAATPDGKTVYFCDAPGSQVIVFKEKDASQQKPAGTDKVSAK